MKYVNAWDLIKGDFFCLLFLLLLFLLLLFLRDKEEEFKSIWWNIFCKYFWH